MFGNLISETSVISGFSILFLVLEHLFHLLHGRVRLSEDEAKQTVS